MYFYLYTAALNVTQLGAKQMTENTCVVTLEGCFPPCCGSRGITERIWFGTEFRYKPALNELCYQMSISMSHGDSTKIYYEQLQASLVVEVESMEHIIDLPLVTEHTDNLQNCFNKCIKTLNIGHLLTERAYTRRCFIVDITLPEGLSITPILKEELTYCTLINGSSAVIIQIECVGFNPLDAVIHEKIIVEIPNTGGCVNDYPIKIGIPVIGTY